MKLYQLSFVRKVNQQIQTESHLIKVEAENRLFKALFAFDAGVITLEELNDFCGLYLAIAR